MVGAIIGDIIGSRFEFNNTNKSSFQLFTKSNSFTDDTVCTIAIADALLSGKSYKDSLIDWCKRYPTPMGAYGASFNQWLLSNNHLPYNSFGNGSAMRVAPVAWWFANCYDVLKNAELSTIPTHNHEEGIKGAKAVAHAILNFRDNGNMESFRNIANSYYPNFHKVVYPINKFDETCQGTVPLCFDIIIRSNSFEDAIRLAISQGGDSDTIGAIVGSIAESIWSIPSNIFNKALSYLPSDMLHVINNFFNHLNNQL